MGELRLILNWARIAKLIREKNMTETSVETIKLDSGMRVLLVEMPGLNSLTALAMVGVGSRYERGHVAGISHFLEHLPFKGTENYPTAMDVAAAIDGVGGKHNAFTGKEYTGYWVKVASGQWKLAMDVVSDLLLTARLREEDIEREKGVIVEEINMYEDNPQFKVSELFDGLVFEGSPLGREVIGSKKTVTSLKRSDFINHWNRWYDPKNVVVGVVGDISKLKAQNSNVKILMESLFNKGNKREGGGKRDYGVPAQSEQRINVFYKDTEQAHFHLGFPGIKRGHKDRYVLSVLVTLLGGNSSSRLFNEIREKRGLAYYAYASADVYYDAGSIYALEGVAVDKVEEAIKVTMEEFGKVVDARDVKSDEVERAKEYVIGKLSLDLEDSAVMANLVVRKMLLENKIEKLEDIVAQVREVRKEQVVDLAKRLIDMDKLNLAVVGPYKREEKFIKLIANSE